MEEKPRKEWLSSSSSRRTKRASAWTPRHLCIGTCFSGGTHHGRCAALRGARCRAAGTLAAICIRGSGPEDIIEFQLERGRNRMPDLVAMDPMRGRR